MFSKRNLYYQIVVNFKDVLPNFKIFIDLVNEL